MNDFYTPTTTRPHRAATARQRLWAIGHAALALMLPAPLLAAEPIVIGQSLPLGVTDDSNSARIVAGALAYVERVNAAGGIRGRLVKLVTLDDGGDPRRHADNLRRLAADEKAVAFINCRGDASCAAGAEVARQLRIPLVGPLSGAQSLSRSVNPYVFRVRAPYTREAEALAKQLVALGTFNVVIATDTRTPSESVLALQEQMARSKLKFTLITVDSNTEAGFAALAKDLEGGRYQAAFLELRTETYAQLAQRKADGKSDPWPLVVTTFAAGSVNSFFNVFTNRMLGFTAVVPNPELAPIALARELQQHADQAGGGSALTYAGMEGYINTKVCLEAVRRAEAAKGDAHSVWAALNALGRVDLGGFYINFGAAGASASEWVDIVVRSRTGALLSKAKLDAPAASGLGVQAGLVGGLVGGLAGDFSAELGLGLEFGLGA